MRGVGTVLVAVEDGTCVGMIGGAVYPHFLTGLRTANEAWWWVEPHARNGRTGRELLRAFTAWAQAAGATRLEIGSRDERLDRFYQRLGFAPVERIFAKDLT